MEKLNQHHHASVVGRATMDSVRALGRGLFENLRQSPPLATQKWRRHVAPAVHLETQMETAQSASTLGDLEATRKRQSCHKLVSGNWKITSLTGKYHKLVEEAKRCSMDVLGISSTERGGYNVVDLDGEWKLFYSGVEPAKADQAEDDDTCKPSAGKLR